MHCQMECQRKAKPSWVGKASLEQFPVVGDNWQWIPLLRTDNQGREPAEPRENTRKNQVNCDWVLPQRAMDAHSVPFSPEWNAPHLRRRTFAFGRSRTAAEQDRSNAVSGGHTAHKLMIRLDSLLHLLAPAFILRGYPWSCRGFSDGMAPLARGAFAWRLNVFILTK